MSNAQAGNMPIEITNLENAFNSVPGVKDPGVGRHQFSPDDVKQLNEIHFGGEYADLPIAMFRRTNGSLEKELLIFVDFQIEPNQVGLKALEFLSWWVRDLSRSGENVQIRSIGLPPMAGENIQLGRTLRFWFEAYIVTEKEDMQLVLAKIGELAKSLGSSTKIYEPAFSK